MAITQGQNANASDFINAAGRNATPANDAGKGVKLESGGKFSEAFIQSLLASGTTSTLSVTTKVDTRLLVIAKGDLTINGTGSVTISYDGVEKDRILGALPKKNIEQAIENALGHRLSA